MAFADVVKIFPEDGALIVDIVTTIPEVGAFFPDVVTITLQKIIASSVCTIE